MSKNKEIRNLFNPAFKELGEKIEHQSSKVEKPDKPTPKKNRDTDKDRTFFLDAMADVEPLPGDKGNVVPTPGSNRQPSHPAPDDEREAKVHLSGLIKGSIELDITFSDEYMAGCVRGFSPKLMRRLKRGQFPYKNHIDLHGLTKKEAEEQVRDFLIRSHRQGHRCVLIVHGRGLNSPDSFPVLKEGLPVWLNRGPAKKIVLAFATAKPYDGGTGAIYVLLRNR